MARVFLLWKRDENGDIINNISDMEEMETAYVDVIMTWIQKELERQEKES